MPQQPHAPLRSVLIGYSLPKVLPSSRLRASQTWRSSSLVTEPSLNACQATKTLPAASAATVPPPSRASVSRSRIAFEIQEVKVAFAVHERLRLDAAVRRPHDVHALAARPG